MWANRQALFDPSDEKQTISSWYGHAIFGGETVLFGILVDVHTGVLSLHPPYVVGCASKGIVQDGVLGAPQLLLGTVHIGSKRSGVL